VSTRGDRSTIRPEHFVVAPEMLGLPLARPFRRLVAIAIDGILVAILVKSGATFLGLSAALILFRASARNTREGGFMKEPVRNALRIGGAIVLFILVVDGINGLKTKMTDKVTDGINEATSTDTSATNIGDLNFNIPPGKTGSFAKAMLQLTSADDSAEVYNASRTLLLIMKEGKVTSAQMHENRGEFVQILGDDPPEDKIAGLDAALISVAGVPRNEDQVDSVMTHEDSLSAQLATLRKENAQLNSRKDKLEQELEDAKKPHGVRTFLKGAMDDLGVGFGWAAVYFTAFLAMWRGQTPGKKLLGMRVLRLDGKPLGWWMSFERFGGYAASASVGLLGFAQILWDKNRQGLHDKACETVVVIDRKKADPLPAAHYATRPRP
jgi:hypothetical protein